MKIETKEQHEEFLLEAVTLAAPDPERDSVEGIRLHKLATAIVAYEKEQFSIEAVSEDVKKILDHLDERIKQFNLKAEFYRKRLSEDQSSIGAVSDACLQREWVCKAISLDDLRLWINNVII